MGKRRSMWMGTRNYERWVPAPDAKPDFSRVGVREQDVYLNGGSGIRGSKDGHREYNMTWTGRSADEMRPVLDFAEGLYDTGMGFDLIYFLDPNTLTRNVLPPMIAAPYKTGLDGVPMLEDADGYPVYPTVKAGTSNTRGYPVRAALYDMNAGTVPVKTYVPIPEGKTLWVGAHGISDGGSVMVTPFKGSAGFAPVALQMLGVDTDTRVNASWSRAQGWTGIELWIAPTTGNSGKVTLQGIMAQVLEDNAIPFPGDFISGQGNSGCEFAGTPTESPYLNGKMTGMSAKLVETGSWR